MDLKVLKALVQRAVAVAAMPDINLPIQVPGRSFENPANGKYLEVVYLPNNSPLIKDRTWGNDENFQGVMRLILHYPKDDTGDYPPFELCGKIKEQFKKGSRINSDDISLLIYANTTVGDEIPTSAERLFPVTVRYQFFHASLT